MAAPAVLHGAVHVVVVGCGRVGSGLAVGLAQQGHSVAILDKAPRSFRRLPGGWPGTTVVGSGFDRDDLDRAGAGSADALAAVTSGDNSNILTARIARENYGIANVVARIYDPRRAEIYQRLGIPTVATVTWTIDQVLRRLLPATVTGEWTDSTGQLVLVEHLLPEAWAGKRLSDLGLAGRATLVAVTRAGVPRLDVAAMVGQEGDVLHVAVMKDAMTDLESRIESGTAAEKPVEGRRRP
jgi:trk system potassium uptake protein TrkA